MQTTELERAMGVVVAGHAITYMQVAVEVIVPGSAGMRSARTSLMRIVSVSLTLRWTVSAVQTL